MSSIFLSHNSKDKPWVRELAKRLTADGVVVWLDEAELNIGDSLIERISKGIENMEYVAAVLSNNSISSVWVQKELSLAMSKEIAGRKVTVLPLLVEKCQLPESLRDKLYADFTEQENYEAEYEKLLRSMGVAVPRKRANANVNHPAQLQTRRAPTPDQLKIVGIVKEKTKQDSQYPGLQNYYFRLSRHPSNAWERHFIEARRFPRHTMWRQAWVEGDCIVVKCALDELQRYHLIDLKQDVETANNALAQDIVAEQSRRAHEEEQKARERAKRDAALDRLKFD